jgi:uncharacterized membrane protein YukC
MADVEFDEIENEYIPTRKVEAPKEKADLSTVLVKKGVVKDHKTGETILIIVSIILLAIAAYNVYSRMEKNNAVEQAQQLRPEDQVTRTVPGS